MSVAGQRSAVSVQDIRRRKGGEPIVCLTAYTAPIARILDPRVDLVLVGDTLGMVVYGMETTLGVTLDTMIAHGRTVARCCRHACVVVDMPFGSYQESPQQAYRNAARVLAETGCAAVKLEGGAEMAETVAYLVKRGIPVLGHVGLLPQSVNAYGGFRYQGRDDAGARQILADAKAIAEAGAFAMVIEATTEPVAREITAEVPVPTIGIGASVACDGQVLVIDDLLGLGDDYAPRFVKRYAAIGQLIASAVNDYAEDVRARRFPGPEHCFGRTEKSK